MRTVVRLVATNLVKRGYEGNAGVLREAADTTSVPADELLAMREALVLTRSGWMDAGNQTRDLAERALRDSKRLAIDL
jgi:hypothetical protein